MQEHADSNLWSETDIALAGLAHQSTGKLGLLLMSNRWKTVDWQIPLPRFKECGILDRVYSPTHSECNHPLSPRFDSEEPFLGHCVAENTYWKTVDSVHRRIEADTAVRKLEGSKNRTADTALAEKIRRRNLKKRREITRSI